MPQPLWNGQSCPYWTELKAPPFVQELIHLARDPTIHCKVPRPVGLIDSLASHITPIRYWGFSCVDTLKAVVPVHAWG